MFPNLPSVPPYWQLSLLLYHSSAHVESDQQEKMGGKISVMLSTLPTWGPGHLRYRDNDPNAAGTEREVIFLQAGDIFYKNLGEQCVEHGIGVDLFIMSSTYIDIATVGI